MPKLDETRPFLACNIAILTVSDTRDPASDRSGNALAEMIARDGHRVAARTIVRDEVALIQAQLKAWIADPAIDVVISTGGTGVTGRDVTPEAFEPLYEKKIDGFGELFRMISFPKVGTSAMLSRAVGGLAGQTLLFAMPGSVNAVTLAMDQLIVPELPHLVWERKR